MTDNPLQYEQEHLKKVYGVLLEMEEQLSKQIAEISDTVSEERKSIWEDMTLNFDGDVNTQETYAEFEVMNHVIDSYNIISDAARGKLQKVKMLLESPYFAKIRLRYDPDEEPEEYYIGRAGIGKNSRDRMILDWRSPIAEVYYNQENGRTSYTVDGRRIEVELLLRRQFDIKKDELRSCFDTTVAIEDPLLLAALSRQHNAKMQAITATIQKEQNAVIRHPNVPVLLVNGIAGSGKTSVLLQRIAYLFYKERNTLRPDDVYLITLNPVFSSYIAEVLPDMGETNPNTMTFAEFMDSLGAGRNDSFRTTAADLYKIRDGLSKITLEAEDFAPIYQSGDKLLSPGKIAAYVARHSHIQPGPRLFGIAAEELEEAVKKIARRKRNGEEKKQEEDLSGLSRKEMNDIESSFGGAIQAVRRFRWIRFDRLAKKLLGKDNISALELLWLRLLLTGECDRNAKYCMIDEVQDYTQAQIMVLMKYFVNARFILLGDENQAIREGTVSFETIKQLFSENGKKTTELQLMTSYRSTPEITEVFAGLLDEKDRIRISSVRRQGTPVEFKECIGNYKEALLQSIREKEALSEDGITAIVTRDRESLERIKRLLGDQAPAVLQKNSLLEGHGVIMLELAMAKGLEFDHVIIPDADKKAYTGNSRLSRNRLYTSISRATQSVTILSDGPMTELI